MRRWLGGVQDERKNSVEIAGTLVHGCDVAVHGEFAGTKADRYLGSCEQEVRQAGHSALLCVRHALAVVEREVVAGRLWIVMNIFEQARANVEILRSPRRFPGFLVKAQISDRLLRSLELSLLLVVVEDARGGVQVLWIRVQRAVSLIEEFAQALRVA